MKRRFWLSLITCLAYCINKEPYKAIDYLREQVRVLIEHQERQHKRILLTDSQRMRYILGQYCAYYHHERIHQGVGRIIEPRHAIDDMADIVCIERLGGLLKSYHRLAA